MRVTSDLGEIKKKYESTPKETNLIQTDSDILITTGLTTKRTKTMDPLELVAWARSDKVDPRYYYITTVLRGEVNELFRNRINQLKDFVPVSILRQSRIGSSKLNDPFLNIISEKHLIMETILGFRRRGIMKSLLKIREGLSGVFEENYTANSMNANFLLRNGYQIDKVFRENEYEMETDEWMDEFIISEIRKRMAELPSIIDVFELTPGANPVIMREDILKIISLPDILILRKE